jgi:predicted nuclease of predicted toxin-antitoxin system
VRVQDTILYEAPDPQVLEWAAQEGRVLLTQDVETMVGFANERLSGGLPMPGVIVVRESLPVGQAVEDLLIILNASEMSDWEN